MNPNLEKKKTQREPQWSGIFVVGRLGSRHFPRFWDHPPPICFRAVLRYRSFLETTNLAWLRSWDFGSWGWMLFEKKHFKKKDVWKYREKKKNHTIYALCIYTWTWFDVHVCSILFTDLYITKTPQKNKKTTLDSTWFCSLYWETISVSWMKTPTDLEGTKKVQPHFKRFWSRSEFAHFPPKKKMSISSPTPGFHVG